MRSTKQEVDYENAYRKDVEDDGGECLKVQVLSRPGYPDRLVLRGFKFATQLVQDVVFRETGKLVPHDECARAAKEIVACAIHFTEAKKPGGTWRPKQKPTIRRLRRMGYRVDILNGSVD